MAASPLAITASPRGSVTAATPPVVFFDGECGLCNRFVRWLLDRDRAQVLRFAPLRGELASRKLPALPRDDRHWSVVLWDEGGVHRDSAAALRAIARVGGPWRAARLLLWVPRPVRDGVYGLVARDRIRWFGRVESCSLLSADERSRLLP